jgi:hypothetical protein
MVVQWRSKNDNGRLISMRHARNSPKPRPKRADESDCRPSNSLKMWRPPCEHLAAYQSHSGCSRGAKRPLPSAFSAVKRLSVAQTSSWKVPSNGPKTLFKYIPAVARRYSHFTAKTGVMLLAGLSQVKLSCQIVSRTFLLMRKTFPSSRLGPQKPLYYEQFQRLNPTSFRETETWPASVL